MSYNVLVVDDSAVMRSMVIRTLHLAGLPIGEIHEAGNGAEALEVLGRDWIDIAMLDINMPVMDGETLLGRVREDPATRDLVVVVVSTERSTARIERLRALGAEFVHKPFRPETIRAVITQITGVHHDQSGGELAVLGGELDF